MSVSASSAAVSEAITAPDISGDIVVDYRTGAVTGAAPHERLALLGLRIAASLLVPLENLGFSKIAKLVRIVLPSKKMVLMRLDDDALLRVPYCDPYWGSLVRPQQDEHQEINTFVRMMREVPYAFLDCGANYGIWSVRVTGNAAGHKPSVAIEAASDTFGILEANQALNGNRFRIMNKAIGKVSGEHVKIYGEKHEARSTVAPDETSKPILDCETISLNDVAALDDFEGFVTFVVKLDVEGVEIEALEGAQQLIDSDTVVLFEEHGSDPTHEVSDFAMNTLGMRLFFFHNDQVREITELKQIDAIKTSKRQGYDMAGTTSQKWIDRITPLIRTGTEG
ncbi:MAG: FkbM family methyltransferase [Pseudomonadota bacterium]